MPNSISGAVPAVWSKYLAKTFDAASVMVPLVNRSVEGDLASAGDTVHVQKYGNVSVSNYTEGSDNTVQTVSLTDATLVLNQKKYFQFVIDSIEQATAHLDLVKGFSKRAMVTMAQTIDDRLFTHYADTDAANVIGTTTNPISLTIDNVYHYFIEARRLLKAKNALEGLDDDPVAVVDVGTEALILKSPRFVQQTSEGDSVVRKATIGHLAGFRVVVSNRITAVSNTLPLMFFTKDFISFAMRITPDKFETYKPEKQFGTGVKGLAFYGSKVFNDDAGVVLYKAN